MFVKLSLMAQKNIMIDLLMNELRDLYSAETQLLHKLPKWADAVFNDALKMNLLNYMEETRKNKELLEQISGIMGKDITGLLCGVIKDVLREGEDLISSNLISSLLYEEINQIVQHMAHYKIAAYGVSVNYADLLLEDEVASLLTISLNREREIEKGLKTLEGSNVQKAEEVIL